jgi:hypothetical protein
MAICVRALARKNELRARARDKRASEQASKRTLFLLFFLPIVYICAHTHALLFFFSLLFDDQCIRDIVFQACSRCPRRFTSIYYSLTNEKEEKKRMSSKLSGERASTNLDNDAISFFSLYVRSSYDRESEKKREKERRNKRRT